MPCRIENISETGTLLRTDELLVVGALVYIRLSASFLGTSVLPGRIARVVPPGEGDVWGYGVKFEGIGEGDKVRIAEYAASLIEPPDA